MKNRIIIYLGSKCNLNCAYCHREKERDKDIDDSFLESLKSFDGEIIFRGGEPTLYMEQIKRFVDASPMATYRITTNGLLFDQYKDFFQKHNFGVHISYDGNTIRPFDPFTKTIHYHKIDATSVLTKGDRLMPLLDEFDRKSLIIGHRITYYPHIGHYTYEGNKEYAMTMEDYNALLADIKNCMKLFVGERERYCFTNMRYYGIHRYLKDCYESNYTFGETRCASLRTKRVDVTGQRFDCLYIRDNPLMDDWLDAQKKMIASKFPKCVGCPVYDMCGAGCVKSLYHDEECWFYKNIFSWYKQFHRENEAYLY